MEESGLRSGHWAEIAPALNGWYNVHLYLDGRHVGVQVCATLGFAGVVHERWVKHKQRYYI